MTWHHRFQVVEGIVGWREATSQAPNAPYLVRGEPYIEALKTDLAFLDEIPEFRTWLGFDATGNPLLLPRLIYVPLYAWRVPFLCLIFFLGSGPIEALFSPRVPPESPDPRRKITRHVHPGMGSSPWQERGLISLW